MRSNDWHLLTGDQWLAMLLIVLGSCVISVWLEWASNPHRVNKWSDWKR